MATASDPISIAILIFLMFISSVLVGYVAMFLYGRYKRSKGEGYQQYDLLQSSWLDSERKPLIPGNFHTRTVQPVLDDDDDMEDDEEDRVDARDFKERDFSTLGRIIFVMRYNKRREELMVRLVQIEGLPVSKEFYSPNSAYVDVQLKYTGEDSTLPNDQVTTPPRLDICLQQVYYFIISTQQMMSHSLEFQINTFDDHFRRFVSGIVEMNLCDELGDDILTGNEVVFVKEIFEPFRFSEEQKLEDNEFVSATSEIEYNKIEVQQTRDEQILIEEEEDQECLSRESLVSSRESVASSRASNMSWEPEVSHDLLTFSTTSLFKRCTSEQDLAAMNPLTHYKRAYSVGYLPTYEWTVKDISLGEEESFQQTEDHGVEIDSHNTCGRDTKADDIDYYKLYEDSPEDGHTTTMSREQFAKPPPEFFYRIVPDTPSLSLENNSKVHAYEFPSSNTSHSNTTKRVAYKKHAKRKFVGRSFSINKRPSSMKHKSKKLQKSGHALERSSSWPSLLPEATPTSTEVSPVHKFFPE